ncbi:MAG: helix-turn-helix domain-containing protein [Candidatus Binatia bacterium]
MPRQSPFRIMLTRKERQILTERARKYTLPYYSVVRAKLILLAAEGLGNDAIASRLDVGRDVVSQWRRRFFEQRVPGLEERQRSGRPRVSRPGGGLVA